jgi:hypothetical protein
MNREAYESSRQCTGGVFKRIDEVKLNWDTGEKMGPKQSEKEEKTIQCRHHAYQLVVSSHGCNLPVKYLPNPNIPT